MNLTWGDTDRRRASIYVDKCVYSTNPGSMWKSEEWIQNYMRGAYPDPRSLIPILPTKDIAYDELIDNVGIDLDPNHWAELFAAVTSKGIKLFLAVAWTWPAVVLPILERAVTYSNVIICPEWYLYPWRGSGMNAEAWASAYWLASKPGMLARSCPLYIVANRPDLGQSYDSFNSLRGLKGGQTVNLIKFQRQYQNYNAGLWGTNYPAIGTPPGVRDDAVQQFDHATEIGFWT